MLSRCIPLIASRQAVAVLCARLLSQDMGDLDICCEHACRAPISYDTSCAASVCDVAACIQEEQLISQGHDCLGMTRLCAQARETQCPHNLTDIWLQHDRTSLMLGASQPLLEGGIQRSIVQYL